MNIKEKKELRLFDKYKGTVNEKFEQMRKQTIEEFAERIDKYTDKIWIKDAHLIKYQEDYEKGHAQGWNDAIDEIWSEIKKQMLENK